MIPPGALKRLWGAQGISEGEGRDLRVPPVCPPHRGATTMSGDEEFYLFKNGSSVGPWDGPQYHIAPPWAFYLQTAFMGFVFLVGTPLNAIVLVVTVKYKKLRQPLNYILVNISFSGFISCIFSVFTVFVSSSQGYFVFGKDMCALEGFVGATGGRVGGQRRGVVGLEGLG